MLTLNDGRSELWQWDTNRKLTVDADCSQVHFSNKVFGRSIDVDVVDGVAIIPDVLLQTDKELTAWAFVGTPENGYTKISKAFNVNRRNKPADYVFTPTDQTKLGEILDRIEDLENRPSGDVSEEDIQNAVNDYLEKNPVSIDEKDPTVPAWAKQATKPSYTAAEVGALPNTIDIPTVPSALPNPHKLKFTGAVQAEYDGSEEATIEIPEGGGSDTDVPEGFQLISFLETTEEVNTIDVSVADDGETVADKQLTEAMLQLFCPRNADFPASGVAVNITLWYPYDAFGAYTISPAMGQTQVWTALYLKTCGIPTVYHFHQDGDFKGAGGSNLVYTSVGNTEAESREPYFYHKGFRLRSVNNVFPIGTKVRIFGR